MTVKNRRLLFVIVLTAVGLLAVIFARSYYPETVLKQEEEEHVEGLVGDYYTLVDEASNVLLMTSFKVVVGDMFLDHDNRLWEVISVDGFTAQTRLLKRLDLNREESVFSEEDEQAEVEYAQWEKLNGKIGVYHTHTGESYVPNAGKPLVNGHGGIVQVGVSFSEALCRQGIEVIHSKKNFLPHDAAAYNRSRRTARTMVNQGVDAVFDIHRDAAPAGSYRERINGRTLVQVLLVVGRQNQNMQINDRFAQGLKRVADSMYPNLVKGIFYARGNYNQDLMARSLLLEFGTHENDRSKAQASAELFADVVGRYLYGAPNTAAGAERRRAESRTGIIGVIGWLLAAVIVGAAGYLLVASGDWKEAAEKIRQFSSTEFGDLLGRIKRRNSGEDDR